MKRDNNILLPVKYNILKICKSHIDTSSTEDGNLHKILAFSTFQIEESTLIFSPDFGSCDSNDTKQNILTEFLNIEVYNVDSFMNFVNKYGFLNWPSDTNFHKCNLTNLWDYIEMLKNIILLKVEISKEVPSVELLLKYCFSIIRNHGCIPYLICMEDEISSPDPNDTLFPSIYKILSMPYKRRDSSNLPFEIESQSEFIQSTTIGQKIHELNYSKDLPWTTSTPLENDAITFFHYIYEIRPYDSIDDITPELLDEHAIIMLKDLANNLCDTLCKKHLFLNTKYDSKNKCCLELTNSSAAIFLTLSQMDFSKIIFDICRKDNCSNFFIRRRSDMKSCYCCTAHAKNAAQATYRKKHLKNTKSSN
ncbi:hypothetical protein SAMN02910384_03195 [Pseudobutyrivibrio sp. ACV-2]|uniref:hypothetical protein n=1 Tax=Pseudobutyrivibrio sp. ACV-2 TaxID=1520801 RepID=UPI00089BB316|nr:hypothetical protein [Pseudobutyrivibrio sp. ACV-2]SEB04474.1 hypothetical protein SAMN02910384_03195 [Pseudobutyrivibrio sp. ACV-2]